MSGPEDPRPGYDWDSFRAARDRFLARARPEAMDDPRHSPCADGVPADWRLASRRSGAGERE